ncbi:MAG TPA: flagellar basal-body MS-ring/collar protein FliF [Thermodesulfovibrionales bacterium]|nr:flagellar basal-body MS-ring/collar protein FliF [Thermodesulfovibrionales bacterium]
MAGIADIGERLRTLPTPKKIILLVVVALTITAVILLFTWSQKADYQLLYSNLTEEDSGSIIQKLNEQKIPYRVSAGGIMVPADKVYDLRLQLASQGLPQGGGIGFEVFDKTSFTMTDFVQKLNYRRALQGELSRTVRALAEVEQCRVHLAVPEKSLFTKDEDRPKASVLIKLRQGRRLSQSQVQGIVHLVSSSVEGLNPKDVAVVDSRGEMLTAADDGLGMTSGQLEYQHTLEKELENRVVGILEPVVGKGKVRAKVAATIDLTKIEKTEERFDPESQVVRSEQRNAEKTTNGTTGGVPGTASNLPGKTATQAAVSQAQSERKNETINYEISKVTSHVVNASGDVKRLSVIALVDGVYTAQQGSKEKKYAPRPEEEIKKFEDMVKNAVGFTADRGDDVRVVNMPFEGPQQEELPEPKTDIIAYVSMAAKYFVPLLALIMVFLFVFRPLMKVLTASPVMQRAPVQLPQTVAEIEKALELAGKPAGANLIEWAKKNPKEAADLIKNWIEEK